MIITNLAPNEYFDDVLISFKLLFQPWRWLKGKEKENVKEKLIELFKLSHNVFQIALFLSGRSALFHLLKALDLKKGDEILIQAFTCSAVVLPIIALKLKPVYVDIENQSFSMSPIDLEKKISPRAKVLILQYTFGITPNQRETILSFVRKHNLVLIEDIAHTIKISNLRNQVLKIKNHFLLLSFGRSKSVSSVFGGAIIGNDKKIMRKLENLDLKYPSYSFIFRCLLYKPIVFIIKLTYSLYLGKILHKIANFFHLLIPEISKKEKEGQFDEIYNKAYPNALAILLLNQLKKINKINQKRKIIVNFYFNKLKKNFYLLNSVLYLNQPLIRFPLLVENRDKIIKNMARNGIFLGKWYDQPVAPKGLFLNRVEYKLGSCPAVEKISQIILNLPTNISQNEAEKIIITLNDVINKTGVRS